MMLSEQISANKGNSKNSALSPRELEHNTIMNLTSPREDKFLSYQFKLPRVSTQSMPRKNKYLLQYKMGKPWIYDTANMNNWLQLPSTSLGCDFHVCKPFRTSSRSAKIMRALSSDRSSFRDRNIEIRKSLNFDLTPSPNEHNSYDESSTSSISTNTPPSILNSSTTDSSDNSVPIASVESIDENQNQTPQQNRKCIKLLNNRSKEYLSIRSRGSYLMSLLERPKENANFGTSSHSVYSNVPSRIINASTPRNLSQEFNQEVHDRPHTPENVINVIPESISAIKKSHKKEKLYCHEEQSFTQRADSIKNDNLHPKTTTESLEIDMVAIDMEASCSGASENESQKKNRNIKRTLIYNLDDELDSDISDLDYSVQQKTTSTENDSLESGLDRIESDEMQDDSNDCKSHEENMQISIDLIDDDDGKEDCSMQNVCNEEVKLSLREESSSTCNVNVMSENEMTSPESNPVISQNTNKVVTPENHVNILTESIKKSHKKIKHGNRRALFETKDLHEKMELAKSEISVENACNNDQNIKSQVADTSCIINSKNSDRPSTPENINSSRLLLFDFNSVKKSHKKDKHSKRTSSFERHDYEYRKRNNSLRSKYEEEIINRSLQRNESLGLEESPGKSPMRKKKPVSMLLQSSTPKMSSAFMFLGCKNIDDEFKIYTPIKKPQILYTVTHHVSADEMTQEIDESAQATSKEIDCSRCVTPVARCFKGSRKNQDLTSERDNAKETDTSVSKVEDTENLKNNGRSTPINMSTMELLCNVDSIKKSHKKDKHSRNRRPISEKKRSYIAESKHTLLSLKHHVDNHCTEKEMCSNTREKEKDKSYREIDYDDPQPSTSRGGENIEDTKDTTRSMLLNTTPPNSLNAMNLIKLLHTTSIKKSHKKERDFNAQAKYILMSQEHELSDDGSIFDEEDRLMSFIEHDNSNEITTI